MKRKRVTPLSKLTKRGLYRRCKELVRSHNAMAHKLYDGIGLTAEYTLEQDMKAGMTVQVRVPRPFVTFP